ncbi:hypothetical protein [Caulobacter sp. DWR1-3-2b1]|uniref:hypothetical protein n=1 Tax=Caulobacter sp. DWR1-3-2b1 TaxID=2804670 RepID=UPI003CF6DE28
MKPSPEDVAVMLVAMVRRVGGRRGAGSRWRFSEKTLRRVSGRMLLREAFIEAMQEEAATIGYTIIPLPIGGYGMIETTAVGSWPLIAGRERLQEEVAALEANDEARFRALINAARAEYLTPATDAESDGDADE